MNKNVITSSILISIITTNCFANGYLSPRSQVSNKLEASPIRLCIKRESSQLLLGEQSAESCECDSKTAVNKFKNHPLPKDYSNFKDYINDWQPSPSERLIWDRHGQRMNAITESDQEKIFGELLRLKSLNNVLQSYSIANKKPFDLVGKLNPEKCNPSIIKGIKVKADEQKDLFKTKNIKLRPNLKLSLGYQLDLIDGAKNVEKLKRELIVHKKKIEKIEAKISKNNKAVHTGKSKTKCVTDQFTKLVECHDFPIYYNPKAKALSANYRELKNTLSKMELTKKEIILGLGMFPELLHDRKTGFWSKDEIWEEQPWILKVSKMIPGSADVKNFLKDSKTTMEDNVIKTIHSLCMVPKHQPKTHYNKQQTVHYKDSGKALPQKYNQCHLRLNAEKPLRVEKIKLLEKLLMDRRNSHDSAIKTRIARLCEEETPYTLNQLLNFKSARESVLNEFKQPYLKFNAINKCSQKSKESEEFYRKWSALGVGMGCLVGSVALGFSGVGAPLIGAIGAACTGVDIAVAVDNMSYHEDNFLKVSRCTNTHMQSCGMSAYKQAVKNYNNAINDIYYAVGGAVLGDIAIPYAFSKVGQLRRIKEMAKYVEENVQHLPADVATTFNHELAKLNNLKGKEKVKALVNLKADLEDFRYLQDDLLKQGRNINEVLKSCFIK
jgi:hypothetical protein